MNSALQLDTSSLYATEAQPTPLGYNTGYNSKLNVRSSSIDLQPFNQGATMYYDTRHLKQVKQENPHIVTGTHHFPQQEAMYQT